MLYAKPGVPAIAGMAHWSNDCLDKSNAGPGLADRLPSVGSCAVNQSGVLETGSRPCCISLRRFKGFQGSVAVFALAGEFSLQIE